MRLGPEPLQLRHRRCGLLNIVHQIINQQKMNSSSASASFIINTAVRLSFWLLTPLLWCQKSRHLGFSEGSHSPELGANKLHCCLDLCPVSPVQSHEDQTLLSDIGCMPGVVNSLFCRSVQFPAAVREDGEK
jgi:hypothetical protein